MLYTFWFSPAHLLTIINNITLLVFYTEAHCWQFRLISAGGEVFGERKLYYTPEAAEKAGREWIYQGH
ncbi:MAG: hypothetical protein HUM72_24950 [Dolichospermum sp.]|nr:hypothetical protein [Dolichospermum sp.]